MGPIQTSVGLHIVESDLRIAVLHARFGKLRLIQSLQIQDFNHLTEEQRQSALGALLRKHHLFRSRVFLTLPRKVGVIRQIELPVEIGDRLQSAIALQIESLSPWALEEVYWDYASEKPGKRAKTLKVSIAIIPRSVLDPWIRFFKSAGLPLAGATLSSLAHAHAASALWPKVSSAVIVNCEPSHVECTVVQDGAIGAVSSEIADAARWQEDANSIVAGLISASKLKPRENAHLVVFGSAAGSLQAEQSTSLPIEKAENAALFGTVAASLSGIRGSGFNVNLIPSGERFKRSHLQAAPTYALAILVVLAGIALAARSPYQWMRYASALDREVRLLEPEVKQVSAQEAELTAIAGQYQALKARLEAHDYNLEALREFARILPQDCWLSNYAYQEQGITLSGYAQSASEIQRIIEESPLFKDVQFTSSVTRDASGNDRFNIKAAIEAAR